MTENEMEPKVNDQWISERQLRHGLMYVCRFVRAFETYSLSRMTRWTVYQKADIHRIMGLGSLHKDDSFSTPSDFYVIVTDKLTNCRRCRSQVNQ